MKPSTMIWIFLRVRRLSVRLTALIRSGQVYRQFNTALKQIVPQIVDSRYGPRQRRKILLLIFLKNNWDHIAASCLMTWVGRTDRWLEIEDLFCTCCAQSEWLQMCLNYLRTFYNWSANFMVGFYEYWTRVRSSVFVHWSVATKKLATNLREVLQCPEKAPTNPTIGRAYYHFHN